MSGTTRTSKHTITTGWRRLLRTLGCLGVITLAAAASALQNGATADEQLDLSARRVIAPLFLEKSSSAPGALKKDTGWQVGGLGNDLTSNVGAGSLSLRGGFFYSRAIAPQGLFDTAPSLANSATRQAGLASLGLTQSEPGGNTQTDTVAYQRINYDIAGLHLNGAYAKVGQGFTGFTELVNQVKSTDAAGAGMLGLGQQQTQYSIGYSGIRGLNLNSSVATLVNSQDGNAQNGLTRTTRSESAALALGSRHTLKYTQSSLTENWDPARGAHVNHELNTRVLQLAGGFGATTQYTLGQTTTEGHTGIATSHVRQDDATLSWKAWKPLAISSSYSSKYTEQTKEQADTYGVDAAAQLLPHTQLTGKWTENTVQTPTNPAAQSSALAMTLASRLSSSLQVTTQYSETTAPVAGATVARDHLAVWTPLPAWKLTLHAQESTNEHSGLLGGRQEFALNGKLGRHGRWGALDLTGRDDTLPLGITQQRCEAAYNQNLGAGQTAAKLQIRTGIYTRTDQTAPVSRQLGLVQLTGWHPIPSTSLSVGYYHGPRVVGQYLAYRAWGQKPQGNAETWSATDLNTYQEVGGELTQKLTRTTTVVVKQYTADQTGVGASSVVEYGMEQRLGALNCKGGQRYTVLAGQTDPSLAHQREDWYRVAFTTRGVLAPWAINSLHSTLFQDGATWSVAQAPAWVVAPINGCSIDRGITLVNGKRTDEYTVQAAQMLGSDVFVEGLYQRNPRKTALPGEVDPVTRNMIHLAYALSTRLQLFSRYVGENRRDTGIDSYSRSLGLIGQLAPGHRLQIEVDSLLSTTDHRHYLTGAAYGFEYERTINADNTLVLKYRLTPYAMSTADEHVKIEVMCKHQF